MSPIIEKILNDRGYVTDQQKQDFIHPDYDKTNHDPFLMAGMRAAIDRLKTAIKKSEKVIIYSDYDVDGTTGAALLLDALPRFDLHVDYYAPDRFKEGYGLNKEALKKISDQGVSLVITLDNGTVSFEEAEFAAKIGLDLIITDHHTPRDELPVAVAVINPKIMVRDHPDSYDKLCRLQSEDEAGIYPFCDLCGCGVAFTLVRALQQEYPGKLPAGQEKWLLDLVAIATVSDLVSLVDQNRSFVYWGLKVLAKTRRPGLKALLATAGIDPQKIDAHTIGFVIGPRINAAGRLKHASLAINLLSAYDTNTALKLAQELEELNSRRKKLQNGIFEAAINQVVATDPIAIVAGDDWHEGVIGIVASRMVEATKKPAFVFSYSEDGSAVKASGRSFGDFSIAAAIHATSSLLVKGGGHAAAGGVTIEKGKFSAWKTAINEYYLSLNLQDQEAALYPDPDITVDSLDKIDTELVDNLTMLEPCGVANPQPTFLLRGLIVDRRQTMGADNQHVKYWLRDDNGNKISTLAFFGADRYTIEPDWVGDPVRVDMLVALEVNEWNGQRTVEGRIIRMEKTIAANSNS